VFGTWLSYSAKHDVLLESGRNGRDTLPDEPKGIRAYKAAAGEVLWVNKSYVGPAMIHGDMILRDQAACDLLTGKPRLRTDPITGKEVEWKWTRAYGCNTPAASEHLLTFRSGAAGYFDLCNDGGTGNWGGFRSSCTNNLIVAGGILTVPDYTRTCTCSYQNQTSLALVHMPDVEMWTYFGAQAGNGLVKRVGINFGAAGDRKSENGTLWIEYPSSGGTSPVVNVTLQGKPEYYRRHSSQVQGDLPWIASSGVKGVTGVKISLIPSVQKPVLPPVKPEDSKPGEKPAEKPSDKPQSPQTPLEQPTPVEHVVVNGTRKFLVCLYFAEPEHEVEGKRVFDVSVQGKPVLEKLDVAKESGGRLRTLKREIRGVVAGAEINLALVPRLGEPILSGIEIVEE
jgi:hypothetical protein